MCDSAGNCAALVLNTGTYYLPVSCVNCGSSATVLMADATGNPTIPQNAAFSMAYNGTTWDRQRGDTTNGLWVNCKTGCGAASATLQTDAYANGTVPQSGSFMSVYNGSTWDRLRGDVTSGAFVNIKNSSIAVTGTFWQATQPVSIAATVTTSQTNTATADYDTGAGVATQHMVGVALPASGGPVAGGTAAAPIRTDPTGTTTQPVSGTFYQATQPVSIATMPSTPVTGTFWQTTQAVSLATNTPDVTDRAARLLGHVVADTGSTTAVTGNVTVVQPTGSNLHIACDSGCGGAASFTDNGAFTFGTTSVNNMGAVVDDVATNSVTENSSGTPRMSSTRILYVDESKGGAIPAGTNVIGHVITDTGSTTAVTGNVAVTNAGLTNIDVALSTRTKPADQQHAIIDSGTTTVTQATAANLNAAVVGTGTAGTAAGGVLTVQGVASMTKLLVTPDSVALPANQSVNVSQINAVTPLMGNGVTGTGSQRVTIASDNTAFAINNTQQGTASQNVAQFGGTNVSTGTGAGGVGIPRVTISNDSSLAANQSVNLAQVGGTAIAIKAVPTNGVGQAAIPTYTNAIQLATYKVMADSIASGALVANTRKDILSLEHAASATKTVKIRRVRIGGFQTTALVGTVYAKIFRGTAASSGGTATTPQPANPATTAAEVTCKTLPTITAATLLDTGTVGFLSAATAQTGFIDLILYDWQEAGETQPLTLRSGTLDTIVIAIYSNVAHNLTLQITVTFTEE